MFFELFFDYQSDLYPMYMYVSFLFTMMYTYRLFQLSHTHVQKYRLLYYKQKHELLKLKKQTSTHDNTPLKATRVWIIKKMNVKDSTDDDAENPFLFFNQLHLKKQGGSSCQKTLYSPIKKLALLDLLYWYYFYPGARLQMGNR
ncbi:hypothetical protein NC661_17285 [Aquibacillus koreensis]|uniref:Uncharacterized protein n=1 Tax=Aquibacillus koreensis TaxID=279446 RepID=A0A9X3WR30_9BACI|nr:hypothetical protein [Aquibacillus koreensis]MCT2536192.1 hypothetical protein [Aquibacillus koreensis]MDC3422116.1 hypothetical protein [Aquibacillus koreensis]